MKKERVGKVGRIDVAVWPGIEIFWYESDIVDQLVRPPEVGRVPVRRQRNTRLVGTYDRF